MLNRYYMKIKAHNPSLETSCEEPDYKQEGKVTRRRGNKDAHLKQNKSRCYKDNKENGNNINVNVNIEQIKRVQRKESRVERRQEVAQQACKDHVGVYEKQILKYLKMREQHFRISPLYIRNHEQFSHKSRKSKIKYFFKVAEKFKLQRNTVFLAVHYFDAYLEKNLNVDRAEVVYLAQAALFIAMKYEEIYPPDLHEWTSHQSKIIEAEAKILKSLDFNITHTTIESYSEFFLSKLSVSEQMQKMIRLTLDTCLFDENMYKEKSQDLALGVIYSIISPEKVGEKMSMMIKWILERCEGCLEWLQETKRY